MNKPIWTRPFIMTVINNFFMFLVFYSLLTILPVYVLDDLHGNEGQAGLVTTIFLIAAIIVRLFAGKILEVFGKRKVLLAGIFLFCIFTFVYPFVNSFFLLMVLRFVHGIFFALCSTVLMTLAADMVPAERKGEGLGYFAMSMNLAVVVGPFLSLALLQILPFKMIFLGLAVVLLIGFACSFGIEVVEEEKTKASPKGRMTLEDIFEFKALPIAFVGFLTSLAYSGIMSFISVYAKALGLFESVSLFFVVFAAVMLLSRPFTGRLFDRSGPSAVIYPSLVIFAIGLFMLSVTHTTGLLLVSAGLIGLGYGALLPSYQTMAIQKAPKERTGHATSTFFIMYDLGIAIGSFALGIVSSHLGYSSLYVVCGSIIIITIAAYAWVSKKRRGRQLETSEAS
ncbi:Uncharacterized MFS-type transporter YwoG [Bacillus sp. 349Y]|jgi:MFS family permease|nr:Uncharacterized MFS-type transporter YwoG [Bacillus sp. 349Y]